MTRTVAPSIGLLICAATLVCGFARPARAMVGDYLSYFNIPQLDPITNKPLPSFTIQNQLLAYINGATPGSEIRGHITTLSKPVITEALINADKRGVKVYLVQDGFGFQASGEAKKLQNHFGTRHQYCYVGSPVGTKNDVGVTSCVSSIAGATHHIKNWLFSNTVVSGKLRTYSSWVTSYNLTYSDDEFNDAFIVNDNYDLYAAYARSFASFHKQRRSSDFYNVPGRGHHVIPSANVEISYAPHTTSPGHKEYHLTNDHVAMALSRIDYEPGCLLQIANLSIASARSAIIDQIRRIAALGCRVQIAFDTAHGSAVRQLRLENVELRQAGSTKIHSKMMLYKGRYDGTPNRTFVWGGSHNWTWFSLRSRDEVFVAISRLGIYKSYSDYFTTIWQRSVAARTAL